MSNFFAYRFQKISNEKAQRFDLSEVIYKWIVKYKISINILQAVKNRQACHEC